MLITGGCTQDVTKQTNTRAPDKQPVRDFAQHESWALLGLNTARACYTCCRVRVLPISSNRSCKCPDSGQFAAQTDYCIVFPRESELFSTSTLNCTTD